MIDRFAIIALNSYLSQRWLVELQYVDKRQIPDVCFTHY